jgi:hypothetical protein
MVKKVVKRKSQLAKSVVKEEEVNTGIGAQEA